MNRLMYSLVMAGVLLVCGGCSSECDPVELCSEMDEVILTYIRQLNLPDRRSVQ